MKIFGVGLSKTGTTSLNSALRMLGFNTVHGPHDPTTQKEFANLQFDLTILREVDGILDIPTSVFYKEFDRQFPNSIFVYTYRQTDDWLRSMDQHYRRSTITPWKRYIRSTTYGIIDYDSDKLRDVFEEHHESVIRYFEGNDRFLEINICGGDRWDKLCTLLDRPIPHYQFPFENRGSIYRPKML